MSDLKFKKAVSLLRVSTERQTTEDDIPSQRSLVNNFIQNREMILVKEFVEGGVSGYKIKHEKRDAIQTIKKMAENSEFEVLVVYKSDRIGRETAESPLAIKFLNDKGIRIFTIDGQELKSGTMHDELITYIEFWRNKGESVKMSERSTDYKKLAIQEGKYTGGWNEMIPFGYRVVDKGNKNNKGKNILDYEIHPEHAEIVKEIFNMSIEKNMGARRIARWLNDNYSHLLKKSKYWNYQGINYIFNNPIYKGYFRMYFKNLDELVISPKQEHLAIITEEIWDKNQEVVQSRKINNKPGVSTRKGPTSGRVLLSGLAYCGLCGHRMHLWSSYNTYKKKNGVKENYVYDYYKCQTHWKCKEKDDNHCGGKRCHSAKRIDASFEKDILNTIKELSKNKLDQNFKIKIEKELNKAINRKKELGKKSEEKQRQILTLKKEIPLAMTGESEFNVSDLKESMSLIQDDVNKIFEEIEQCEKQIAEQQVLVNDYISLDEGIGTWEERYKTADLINKKALINQVVEKIYIYEAKLDIKYRIHFENFEMVSNFSRETGRLTHTSRDISLLKNKLHFNREVAY